MGKCSDWLELWIERMIQVAKLSVEHKALHDSELSFWQWLVDAERLEELAQLYPEHCKPIADEQRQAREQPKAAPSGRRSRAGVWDTVDRYNYKCAGSGKTELVGPYSRVDIDHEWTCITDAMQAKPAHYRSRGWPTPDPEDDACQVDPIERAHAAGRILRVRYDRVTLANGCQFGSVADRCARTDSSWTYLRYKVGECGEQHCIIRVQYYVRVSSAELAPMGIPAEGRPTRLRFAICHAWKAAKVTPAKSPDTNRCPTAQSEFWEVPDLSLRAAYGTRATGKLWAVNVDALESPCPHVTYKRGDQLTGLFLMTNKGTSARG